LLLVGLVLASGCVHRYPQPSLDEPHADVQIRVVHHVELGPAFDEHVRIDDYDVTFGESAPGVRQTTMRVRPQAATWSFETDFYHPITTIQPQTYWQSQSYLCGSSRYGPQYCSRSVPVTRMVPVTVRVPDGGCSTAMPQTPLAGAVYLVQYELIGNGACRATCQRLVAGPGGSPLAVECGAGEPMPEASVPPSGYVDAVMNGTPSQSEFPEEVLPTGTAGSSGGEVVIPAAPTTSTAPPPLH
jgi:hypothetical protein